ncbi:MAG: hypothetical protein V9H26_06345 [Verrucomicrobiota bacterium]|mgnify:CR=1 FL=1|nr:hypothetical protein [Limisphaerales bacterium]
MSEAIQDQTTRWLRTAPSVRGTLVRGIRFADETFVTDVDARDFPVSALETAWRLVADTFAVLRAQHLPPTRLTWVYERTVLHCVQRADGAILGVFVAKKSAETDPAGLDRLLSEFQTLVLPAV